MYSEYGEGAQVLHRIQEEGNEVGLFIHQKEYENAWQGILPRVSSIKKFLDSSTTVIFDSSGNGKLADSLRKSGNFIACASEVQDKMECDRMYGIDLMKEMGIEVPKTVFLNCLCDGKEFVDQTGLRLVFKPCGDMPTKLTYVSKDSDDMLAYFDYLEEEFGDKGCEFILQEFKEGVVVSSELWTDGRRIISPFNHTIENKKFLHDDLGPSTGCEGNIVWREDKDCLLIKKGIALAKEFCLESELHTCLDLNCVTNGEDIWGLEWTPRFGLDAICCLLPLYNGEIGKFFADLARGQCDYEMPLKSEICAGVRLTIPPYPFEPLDDEPMPSDCGIPIRGFEDEDARHVYFYEIRLSEQGRLVHSGGQGLVCCATGIGKTVGEAFELPYKILQNCEVPDKQYRTDVGYKLMECRNKLQELGD